MIRYVSYDTDNYALEYDLIANVSISLEFDTFSLLSNNLIHQNNFFLIEKKGKLQITPLKFGDDWILHFEISEFGFYPLKFGVFRFYTMTF